MKRLLPTLALLGAAALLLAGCTPGNQSADPTGKPTANPTIPVTPVVPTTGPAPLATLNYAGSGSLPTTTFTVPKNGFAVTVNCTISGGGLFYLHYVANKTVSGEYGFICKSGTQYQVVSKTDVAALKIAGKKMTLSVYKGSVKGLAKFDARVTRS